MSTLERHDFQSASHGLIGSTSMGSLTGQIWMEIPSTAGSLLCGNKQTELFSDLIAG